MTTSVVEGSRSDMLMYLGVATNPDVKFWVRVSAWVKTCVFALVLNATKDLVAYEENSVEKIQMGFAGPKIINKENS